MSGEIETVLVATSLAEASDHVVGSGHRIARRTGAALHLFHAYPLPIAYYGTPLGMTAVHPQALETEKERCAAMLDEQLRRLEIEADDVTGSIIEVGAPHRMLLETADELQPDLIVVGSSEHGALEPLLGSTADKVLRKSAVPVLVARDELDLPPARVLAPVDLSELSEDSLRRGLALLAELAGDDAVRIEALFVLSPVDRDGSVHFTPEQVDRFAHEELDRFLARLREGGDQENVELTGEVRCGLPRREIVGELEEQPADLVVIGTHGRSGFERFLLGSVATDVARRAPTSVLVIPPAVARGGESPPTAEEG